VELANVLADIAMGVTVDIFTELAADVIIELTSRTELFIELAGGAEFKA
jgi:hypothetical protein